MIYWCKWWTKTPIPEERRLPVWTRATPSFGEAAATQIGAIEAENEQDLFAQLNAVGVQAVDWVVPRPPTWDPFCAAFPRDDRCWPPRRLDSTDDAPAALGAEHSRETGDLSEGAMAELLVEAMIPQCGGFVRAREGVLVALTEVHQVGRAIYVHVEKAPAGGLSKKRKRVFKMTVEDAGEEVLPVAEKTSASAAGSRPE